MTFLSANVPTNITLVSNNTYCFLNCDASNYFITIKNVDEFSLIVPNCFKNSFKKNEEKKNNGISFYISFPIQSRRDKIVNQNAKVG